MDSLSANVIKEAKNEMLYLYQWLLKKHDWQWRNSDDPRFLAKNIEREQSIEKLRELIDKDSIIYNQFSPYKK